MSIMDRIFGTNPAPAAAPQAQQPAPQAQGNIPSAPTVVAEANNPTAPVTPASPLDQYKTLWENEPNKDGESTEQQPLTNEQVSKAMEGADFSKGMDANLLAAIAAGGEEAQKALPQILNAMARQVMTQSTLVNNKLTEQAVAAAIAKQQKSMPSLLRQQQATDHLKSKNPLFDNPAVKPVMEAARDQLLLKHPNATTAEITDMVHNFVSAMGESFAPKKVTKASPDDIDWGTFLS